MRLNTITIEEAHNKLYKSLKSLIEISHFSQSKFLEDRNLQNNNSFLKEFCTIRFCTARRSGHTTVMCGVAKECFDKVLFLSPNTQMSSNLEKSFLNLYPDLSGSYKFSTYLHPFVATYEAIFIDGTFFLTEQIEKEVYRIPANFYIFIQ